MASFKAIVIDKAEAGQTVRLTDFDEKDLMDGDVTVRPEWSTVNYKDGLAVTGKAPVVRRFPMIAGVDFAGTVESSSHPGWKPGDKVILNGWGLGETHLGAYAQKARVKGDWLVRLPASISARDAMAIGTAGYTAMLSVMALERAGLDAGARPGGRDRRRWRRRLGRRRASGQARLCGRRFDRPAGGGGLSQRPRRHRDHRAQGTERPGAPARQGTLGRRHRRRGLDDARQCAVDDALWRRGRRLWTGGRNGLAGSRSPRSFYAASRSSASTPSCVRCRCGKKRGAAWRPTSTGPRSRRWSSEIGLDEVIAAGRRIVEGQVRGRIVVKIG